MAKFIVGTTESSFFPDFSRPEFVLVGPSNSGKSTLVNALANSKISFTSKTPGKTRSINFYDFEKFYLVDLPGYGYAKGSKKDNEKLLRMLDDYFSKREIIIGAFQICSFHGLSSKDIEVNKYLSNRFHNYFLLINKIDKLSHSKQCQLKKSIEDLLGSSGKNILMISGKKLINISLVRKIINEWLQE